MKVGESCYLQRTPSLNIQYLMIMQEYKKNVFLRMYSKLVFIEAVHVHVHTVHNMLYVTNKDSASSSMTEVEVLCIPT